MLCTTTSAMMNQKPAFYRCGNYDVYAHCCLPDDDDDDGHRWHRLHKSHSVSLFSKVKKNNYSLKKHKDCLSVLFSRHDVKPRPLSTLFLQVFSFEVKPELFFG